MCGGNTRALGEHARPGFFVPWMGERETPAGGWPAGVLLKNFAEDAVFFEEVLQATGTSGGLASGDLMDSNHVGRVAYRPGIVNKCKAFF